MQLVLIAHRGCASFEIRHVGVVVRHYECALELTRVARVDAEIGAQLHRTAHALGNVDERAVAENGTVERGEEVVPVGHDRAEILAHEVGMVLYGVAYRAEDDALLRELLLESGLHRHRVHDGIHRHTAERKAFLERDAELVERLHQLRVYLLLAVVLLLRHRVGVVGNCLIVYLRQVEVSPRRLFLCLPELERLEAEVEHPVRFALLLRDETHHVLVKSLVYYIRMHVCGEPESILLLRHLAHIFILIVVYLLHLCFVVLYACDMHALQVYKDNE